MRTNWPSAGATIAYAASARVRSIGVSVAQQLYQTGHWIGQKRLKSKLTFCCG
jgi:hypothetical protein